MLKKLLAITLIIITTHGFVFAQTIKNEDKNMTRTDICKKNFQTLFKSDALTNTGSDPEMMEILQKYIFGEVFTVGELDLKTREMLIIPILVTTGNSQTLKSHIEGNLKAGNSEETITAVIIQCLPYVGFPNTLAALRTVKEVLSN